MSSRKRIYLAGPLSHGGLAGNLEQAKRAGIALIGLGFAPLVPHLSAYLGEGNEPKVSPHGIQHQHWLEVDLPWVDVADGLLRIPGESKGADMEVARAKAKGIPVFDNVMEVSMHFRKEAGKTGADRRKAALSEVAKCVIRDRQNSYGDAEDSFASIAVHANQVLARKLDEPLDALDVAMFMVCVKLARAGANPHHRDNFIDIGGYGVCAAGILESQKEQPNVH